MTGHLSVQGFALKAFTIDGHPQSVAATFSLNANADFEGTGDEQPFEAKKELFSAGVPDAGLSIPNIFQLGLVASYEVDFQAAVSGKAGVTFGFSASLADSTGFTLDLADSSKSSAVGFEGATLTPDFHINE